MTEYEDLMKNITSQGKLRRWEKNKSTATDNSFENKGDIDLSDDEKTMISEMATSPDRDQIFNESSLGDARSNKQEIEGWSGDDEEQVKGDRNWRTDAANDIQDASNLFYQPNSSENMHHNSTAMDIDPDELEDEELHMLADNLGIPDHRGLPRHQLVTLIRNTSAA